MSEATNLVFQGVFVQNSIKYKFFPVSVAANTYENVFLYLLYHSTTSVYKLFTYSFLLALGFLPFV